MLRAENQSSILDYSRLLECVDGDRDLARELLMDFTTEAPRLLSQMQEFVRSGDAAQLQHTAHCFKGMVGYFGAADLQKTLQSIETPGASATFEQREKMLSQVEKELSALLATMGNQEFEAS